MLSILTIAQSVTAESFMADGGTAKLVIGLIVSAIITGAVVGGILALLGKMVVGHKVRFGSAFLAVFLVVLLQAAIAFGLAETGVVETQTLAIESDTIAHLMPFGPLVFGFMQLIGLVLMVLAARIFLGGPAEERPSWLTALLIAIFTLVVLFLFNVGLVQLRGFAG